MVMGDGLLAKQAVMFLHFRNSFFKACFLIEWTLLILPFLNIWVIQLHKRKFVDFEHNIADRKKLPNLLYQIDVSLQQLICGWRKPSFRSCAIGELCFFIFDADTKYIFLATRKTAFDDTNFFCTLADTAVLGSGLLYALFRKGAIRFSSPLTAAASTIGAPCTARFLTLFHQLRNFLIAGFKMRGEDCRAVFFDNSNADVGSAGVDA